MYLNPARLSIDQQNRVADWMERNGCPDWIALEPVEVRGRRVTFTSYGPKRDEIKVRGYEVASRRRTIWTREQFPGLRNLEAI